MRRSMRGLGTVRQSRRSDSSTTDPNAIQMEYIGKLSTFNATAACESL